MRLLYLGSTDFPQPKARAIQIVHTCHALARAGVEVTLAVGRRGDAPPERALQLYGLEPHPLLRLVAVPILRIPPSAPPRVLRWFTRLWQASYLVGLGSVLRGELLGRRPDVVYARDLRTARLAVGLTHAVGARLGFEVHGLPSFEVREGAGRAVLPPSAAGRLRRLEAAVFARADRIVTITECGRRILLEEYGVSADRVRTVPDGSAVLGESRSSGGSSKAGSWRSPRVARTWNDDGNLPSVYYVGQLYPWKGAGLLIDAATMLPGVKIVVIGGLPAGRNGVPDPQVAELGRRADDVGVGARIQFRGYVPYGGVAEALRGAAVAVLPLPDEPVARYFTSPLKLFDYMAAGVPIVASDLPSLREVLRHGENALLVPPDDAGALAQAIERLLADPGLAARLAARAQHDAAGYTWDARAARLIDFFQLRPGSESSDG